MSSDPKRMGAVLAAALLAVVPAASARASDHDQSAGAHIASALRGSPVYVDPAYGTAVPPSRQRELAAEIKGTHLPLKVVLTPLTKGDAFDGESDVLADVVHDRLPQRELILITTDGEFPDTLNGYEWPSDTHQTVDAVRATAFLDETREAGLADMTAKAVRLVAEGDGTKVYEEATRDLDSPSPEAGAAGAAKSASHGPRSWPWLLIGGAALAVLALALVGGRLAARRHRSRTAAVPELVFATARAADETELRRRAETEVLALGEATREAPVERTPCLQQALDAYTAAGTVLDAARGVPDLAGVLALVTEGENALSGAAAPLPLCFFNPLHGRATARTTWRPLGRRDRLRIATCPGCASALARRRPPEVLTDTGPDGRTVPYFEVPARRSVWAATGYGSYGSPTEQVNRGDFTRSLS